MKKIICVLLLFGCTAAFSVNEDVRTYIPTRAHTYLPILKAEQKQFWNSHPNPEQLGALGEHESCISLTHNRCWSPTSILKTSREEGAGIFQITRAYDKNGKIRFDALQELKDKHPTVLSDWSWENVYKRPDLQLRAVVLKSKDNFDYLKVISNVDERLKFSDAAYNGGMGGVNSDRRLCGLKNGCNPQIWFGNVELTCSKSKVVLYGNRSACDINRYHVNDVINIRSNKYKPYLKNVEPVILPKIEEKITNTYVKKSYLTIFLNILKIFLVK
jgi:hypothetical protein